jgi:HAE1 family hydrophobic/amphiphilic exporter-1
MTMVYVLICVIALVFLPNLDIALYPSVEMPMLTVFVDCDGAGPEEIEQQVAKTLESSLSSLEDLESMTSQCSEGQAMLMLEFIRHGSGRGLRRYLDDHLPGHPSVARLGGTPQVMRFDMSSSSTILRLTLSGDRDTEELQQIADDTVTPLIERISGVSQVEAFGGGTVEYEVNVSKNHTIRALRRVSGTVEYEVNVSQTVLRLMV